MNTRIALLITIATLIVINLFLTFVNSSSWIEFSVFFNGVLMPILTALNVFVFVKLTNIISKKEEIRSEKELSYQKQLLLMQFRKAEIEAFEKSFDNVFLFKNVAEYTDYTSDVSFSVMNALVYLNSFLNTKLSLFNLNKNSKVAIDITNYSLLLKEYHDSLKEKKFPSKEEYDKMFALKDSIIQSLQMITLNSDTIKLYEK